MQLLNSLLLKILVSIFGLLLMSYLASAVSLGVSPASSVLNTNVFEEICKEYILFLSRNLNKSIVEISILWSKEKSNLVADYNLNSENLDIDVEYADLQFMRDSQKTEICFIPNNIGEYYGLIEFDIVEGNIGVGSWVRLNSEGEITRLSLQSNDILLEVSKAEEKADYSKTLFLISEIALSLALLGLLSYLVIK